MTTTEAAFMTTECNQSSFEFHSLNQRKVIAKFDGGNITSDAGILLLREVENRTGLIAGLTECFTDYRDARWVEHTVKELLGQRLFGMCLGYEDLNDHDQLRADPMLAVAVDKSDPLGLNRRQESDRGKALAGKSTLNRLELGKSDPDTYKKIVMHEQKIDAWKVKAFIDAYESAPEEIVLDLDTTDDLIHGNQEGKFFHGYYGNYCYLPLYIFCGEHLLCARLRRSNIDGAEGAIEELNRIVGQIRQAWPEVKIIIRADSGFCRDDLMSWCEDERNRVDYVLGLAKNERLKKEIAEEMKQAEAQFGETQQPARMFKEFRYETLKSWSRERRVIGKAEHLEKGANPRFVVTSLSSDRLDARALYEDFYCARGDMENRIKEQQLDMFADRTSAATMRANQLRLYLSSAAYILMHALRRLGLKDTDMAHAQCQTIRLKLLKIGAQIRVTVRNIWISLAGGYPYANIFSDVVRNLQALPIRC
jgi:Transposase DDE domain group 1